MASIRNRLIVRSQKAWEGIANSLPAGNKREAFQQFLARGYSLDANAKIQLTGKPLNKVLPYADPKRRDGRYAIYQQAMKNGVTISSINQTAARISSSAVENEDAFGALFRGYIQIRQ